MDHRCLGCGKGDLTSQGLSRHYALSRGPRCKAHQEYLRSASIQAAITRNPATSHIQPLPSHLSIIHASQHSADINPQNHPAPSRSPTPDPQPQLGPEQPNRPIQDFFGTYDIEEVEPEEGGEDDDEVEAAGWNALLEKEGDSDDEDLDRLDALTGEPRDEFPNPPGPVSDGPQPFVPMDEDEIRRLQRADDDLQPLVEDLVVQEFGGLAGTPIEEEAELPAFESYSQHLDGSPDNPYRPFTHLIDWSVAQWAKVRGPGDTAFTDLLKIEGVSDYLCLLSLTRCSH